MINLVNLLIFIQVNGEVKQMPKAAFKSMEAPLKQMTELCHKMAQAAGEKGSPEQQNMAKEACSKFEEALQMIK